MSALEQWSDEAFVRLMSDVLEEATAGCAEPVNLSAERQNPVVSWDEFAGDFQ